MTDEARPTEESQPRASSADLRTGAERRTGREPEGQVSGPMTPGEIRAAFRVLRVRARNEVGAHGYAQDYKQRQCGDS